MNSYPLWLLAIPDTQPLLFTEVEEERKNLRYWRETFLRTIKPKLEQGHVLYPEERSECVALGIPIPQSVGVSVERMGFVNEAVAAAQKFNGALIELERGWWTGCGDGVPRSKKCIGLEFRFESEADAEKFIEHVEDDEEGSRLRITGLDTSGLGAYWMSEEHRKRRREFERTFFGKKNRTKKKGGDA